MNDGSTDGSAAILEEYATKDERFKVVTQANAGLSSARNTGLREAQGEYVLFLDSDDWFDQGALETIENNIADEDFIAFNGQLFYQDSGFSDVPDKLENISYSTGWEYYCSHVSETRRMAFVCVVVRCYRRVFLLDNQIFFFPGIYHEDNLFTPIICYYAKQVKQIEDTIYFYRIRPNSIMTSSGEKRHRDLIIIANMLSEFFIPKECIHKDIIYRQIAIRYQSAFFYASHKEDGALLSLVNWRQYFVVSRTRPRHRLNYFALWVYPPFFRWINSHI